MSTVVTPKPVTYGLDPSTPRFTVEQYHKMIDCGILTKYDKMELLEGYLVLKSPLEPLHPQPVTYGLDPAVPRFSVAQYHRMIEEGIFTPEQKLELLENYLVLKMPRNPRHDGTIDLVHAALPPALPSGWRLRIQQAIVLPDGEPEPDGAVVRGTARSYLTQHPRPADVGMLLEVADSSVLRDQRDKTRDYARAVIACYWIINLVERRIEVYTQPSGPGPDPAYASVQTYQPGDTVPLVLDGVVVASIAVADLLP